MGTVTIQQVIDSSAGIFGWAAYDGPTIAFEQPPMYPNKMSRQDIIRAREAKRLSKYYMSEKGQMELAELTKQRGNL